MRYCLFVLALLAACAGRRPTDATPVVDIADLGPDKLTSDDLVLRFPKGTRLPVRVQVDTPFVRADGGPATTLVFERTVYWYLANPRLISFDGETWQRARGQLDLGVSAQADRPPAANVRVALAPR